MWMLDNQTPYKAERTWVRDPNGVHHWIVVVKATYDIGQDGKLTLADEQVEPLFIPEYSGEDGNSSILYDADLVGMKPTTDVILNGTAYAPQGKPVTRVPVMLEVQNICKELWVYGDRIWQRGITSPEPDYPRIFETMPIVYERAFGGIDQIDEDPKRHGIDFRNPFGVGFAVKKSTLLGTPVPNIEYPKKSLAKAGPAGFGAIVSYASPRKEFAGTYDAHWQKTQMPLLPKDYDARFLLCAPIDQQSSQYLRGGEMVQLTNLTPSGSLRFALPEVFLFFETHIGSKQRDHRAALVTVVIEPDHPRLIATWQTSLEVRQNVDYLDKTVIVDKKMERFAESAGSLCCD